MDAEKLLKHMAWANLEIIGKLQNLPDSALEVRGFTSINLDDYDLWAYCDIFGE